VVSRWDDENAVVFAGSFSKVLFPSLRLGYVVVPPELVEPVSAYLSVTSRHASLVNQAVLHAFMAEGHFTRHLRRMQEIYAERHDTLLTGARRLGSRLEVTRVHAGLQTVGHVQRGIDAEAVARMAARHDVETVPLARHARRPLERDGLQLGFAAVPPAEIGRGLEVLARALEPTRRRPQTT
jgi:GntR family transcriptional regulator/MocR family aminotransferase